MPRSTGGALVPLALGVFLAGLDTAVVAVALPSLAASFGVSALWGSWAIGVYALALAVGLPSLAPLGPAVGRRRLLVLALVLLALGSLVVALSPDYPLLLVGRLLQGCAAAGVLSAADGRIRDTLAPERQGWALRLLGASGAAGAVLGPVLGGLVLGPSGEGWRWLFWINVPAGLALGTYALTALPADGAPGDARLDAIGSLLLFLGLLGLMDSLTALRSGGLLRALLRRDFYALAAAGTMFLLALLVYEERVARQGREPVLPAEFLHSPAAVGALALGWVAGLLRGALVFLPGLLQAGLGRTASAAAYWCTIPALLIAAGFAAGRRLAQRRGPIIPLALGIGLGAVGAMLLPLAGSGLAATLFGGGLLGLGAGLAGAAPLDRLCAEDEAGDAARRLPHFGLARGIGLTLGPVALAGFITRALGGLPGFGVTGPQRVAAAPSQGAILGFHHLYFAVLALALVGLGGVWAAGRARRMRGGSSTA